MRRKKLVIGTLAAPLWVVVCVAGALAADAPKGEIPVSLTVEPFRYAAVDGYRQLFEAHHWMGSHYAGGVTHFDIEAKGPNDIQLKADGRAIFDQDDYDTAVRLEREDGSYALLEFKEFRKYYPNRGGFYYPFSTLSSAALNRDLSLDIRSFKTEVGFKPKRLPHIKLIYEYESKDGSKSRLSWAYATEGERAKKIAPSYQDIDETVHVFEIELEDTFRKWEWEVSQKWETVESNTMREEQQLSVTSVADDKKIRNHILNLDVDSVETVLGAERWFFKDRLFVGNHYRFAHLENEEIEQILEMNASRNLQSFSNPHQVLPSPGTNQFVSHTWVGSVFYLITNNLSLSGKTKAENVTRNGQSTFIEDSTGAQTPDGIPTRFTVSDNDSKSGRLGESVSLRYTGIPRTAMYLEGEAEQNRTWLSEFSQSASAANQVDREVLAHLYRWVGTLGGQFQPHDDWKGTLHLRHRYDDIRYNNIRLPSFTASAAKSVFVDGQEVFSDEIATKLSWKPCRWFEPALRYQLRDKEFETWGIPDDKNEVEARDLSNTYTLELNFYPKENLITTASFSYQDAETKTGGKDVKNSIQVPEFNADVLSTMLSVSYQANEKISWNGSAMYSFADNYADYTSFMLPLGVSFNRLDLSLGCAVKLKEDMTLEPKYTFYGYWPTEEMESRYNVNVLWIDMKIKWG